MVTNTTKEIRIIHLHNGLRHADDTVARAILEEVFPEAQVIASRNPADHERADLVVDNGWKFDNVKWFDHHQEEGKPEPRPNGVPYAAAGLILRKFGPAWVKPLADKHGVDAQAVVDEVDRIFVQAIDAKDNGAIDLGACLKGTDVRLSANDFNSLIRMAGTSQFLGETAEDEETLARQATDFAKFILGRVRLQAIALVKARPVIAAADTGDDVLVLETGCPWIGEVVANRPHVKFVVLKGAKDWLVQPVPTGEDAQGEYRVHFPTGWLNKKGQDICTVAGVEGLLTLPKTGHVLFCATREAALAVARKILC